MSRPLIDTAEQVRDSGAESHTRPVPVAIPAPSEPLIIPPSRAQRLTQPDQRPRRRSSRPRLILLLTTACAAAVVAFVVLRHDQTTLTQARAAVARAAARHQLGVHGYPSVPSMIRASNYLGDRQGYDAFAIVDSTGREYGLNDHRTYVSASVTKSMLLVAYLRALAAEHESLGPQSKKLLYPMIHVSDNTAASTVLHWRVYFKGGWRLTVDGQLVSQAGRLEGHDRRVAIAVMTVEDPTMGYGEQTIAGVTSRLLGR